MDMFDCIFIGAATYDIVFLLDSVPTSDQRVEAHTVVRCGGGPASTAAVALQSLGKRTALVSAIGEDEIGSLVLKELIHRKVDVSDVHIMKDRTTNISAIQVEKSTGKRTITTYFGGCLKYLKPQDIDFSRFRNTRMIHLDGNHMDLNMEIVKYCRQNSDAVISLDGGNIPYDQVNEILPYVDIFIPDDKSTLNMLGSVSFEEACRIFYGKGPKIVCITLGDKGSILYDGESFNSVPAYKVDVMDTTGAGDNFHGAFLYGYLEKWTLLKIQKFASAFAALTCQGLGGRSAIPTLEKAFELMQLI